MQYLDLRFEIRRLDYLPRKVNPVYSIDLKGIDAGTLGSLWGVSILETPYVPIGRVFVMDNT